MARKVQGPQSTVEAIRHLSENLRIAASRPSIFNYVPHDKQTDFHSSEEKNRLFIGGNRSGKSVAGVTEDIMWLRGVHPYRPVPVGGCRGRIVTTDFTDGIEKTILPMLAQWVPISELRGNSWSSAYDKQLRTLNLENGSFVELMSYEQDVSKFAGTSRHFVHFDEEPPKEIYTECVMRLLDTDGSWWMTLTPVEGMEWIFEEIYLPGVSRVRPDIHVTEVLTTENPYLGEAEVQQLISTLTREEQEVRIRGKYIRKGGLIYPMFDPERHVIPFTGLPDPNSNLWICALDHGFNNPTGVLWAAADGDGNITIFAEHYKSGETVDYHARAINAREFEWGTELKLRSPAQPHIRTADPSIRNTDSITGTSVLEEYSKFGIFFTLANNDVQAGLVRVARYFKEDRIRITNNCGNLIEELLRYRWATFSSSKVAYSHNVKETPHKKNDHLCDALRYMIMSRPDIEHDSLPIQRPVGPLFADGVSLTASDYDTSLRTQPDNSWETQPTEWTYDENLGSEW